MSLSLIRAGKAVVELFADNKRLVRGLRQAEAQVKAFGNHVQAVGTQLVALGAAASAPFVLSTKVFVGFDDAMKEVKAKTGATEKEFQRLTTTARKLGRTTSYTASQVAGAMVELAQAGMKPGQIDAGISSILMLARATRTELPEAARYAMESMASFGLEVDQLDRVVDVLTATANNSNQNLTDLAESMKYAAPIADEFGMSIEETAKALGTMANYGIRGSMAGTALRKILGNLANGPIRKKLREMFQFDTVDASGNLRSFTDIISDIAAASKDLPSGERIALFQEIFGGRAYGAGMKLTKAQIEQLVEAVDNAQGVAARTAKTMDSGLGGAFRRIASAVEGAGIMIATALSKSLMKVTDHITEIVGQITEWIEKHQGLVVVLAMTAAGILATGAALIGINQIIKLFLFSINGLSTGLLAIKGTLRIVGALLSGLLSPVGLITAAVLALGGIFILTSKTGGKAVEWLAQKFVNLKNEVSTAWKEISAALVAGDLSRAANILWLTLKLQWAKGVFALQSIWIGFKLFFVKIWNEAVYAAMSVIAGLWQAFDTGIIETVGFFQRATNRIVTFFATMGENIAYHFKNGLDSITNFFRRFWTQLSGWAKKEWTDIKNIFNPTIAEEHVKRKIDEETQRKLDEIQDSREKDRADREVKHLNKLHQIKKDQQDKADRQAEELKNKRTQNKEFHDSLLEGIGSDYADQQERAEREKKHQQKIDKANDELAKAKKEWQDAIDESKAQRNPKSENEDTRTVRQKYQDIKQRMAELKAQRQQLLDEGTGGTQEQRAERHRRLQEINSQIAEAKQELAELKAKGTGTDQPDVKKRAEDATSNLEPAIAKIKNSISGSFSGFNRFGFAGTAADERTATATEQIAKNTKDLLNHQRNQENEAVTV